MPLQPMSVRLWAAAILLAGLILGVRDSASSSGEITPAFLPDPPSAFRSCPWVPSLTWTAESNQAESNFGIAVGTAGDINGDGFSDIIVGAHRFDSGAGERGIACVYTGTASGLPTDASWTVVGDQDGAAFGQAVAAAGDVNGDGYGDVIVGAPLYDGGEVDAGRVFVYLGSSAGLPLLPTWTFGGDQGGANLGCAVATAGDVNGDGYADVVVGAAGYDQAETDVGRVYVFHGSESGLGATPAWTIAGSQMGAAFGRVVATAGDVNGDGYGDLIVGAPLYDGGGTDEGRVFVYLGSAGGLSLLPAWTFAGDQNGAKVGCAVATAGDVNGDGYADVVVGAAGYDQAETDEGMAFVFHGSVLGLGATPAWTAAGDQVAAAFGGAVATAGDVDGDGYADLIVGAAGYDNGQLDEGRAYVYVGSEAGLHPMPEWVVESDLVGAAFGFAVATAGDVNGDGYSDLIVGAPAADNGEVEEGQASVYLGLAATLAVELAWTDESDQAGGDFGISVGTAGDVNGDGFSDLIIGSRFFDHGQIDEGRVFVYHGSAAGPEPDPAWSFESNQGGGCLGYSVATAGDVNGDGYADVIAGAYGYDTGGGETDEGAAYLFLGSPSGLEAAPAWMINGGQATANLGISVGTAGDVNGDGFSDVIVGAYLHDSPTYNEGLVQVFYGSPLGLAPVPDWTMAGSRPAALFGTSVATAGDVNGDGYSDVVIGAVGYTGGEVREGAAFVYHGSAAGLAGSPAWMAEGNQAEAYMGWRVNTAGDVNGDGFSDVIVSAVYYDRGQTDEGVAFVYLGSAAGLDSEPGFILEGDQVGAEVFSVAGAGDVDGDGFSDVLTGAWRYDHGTTDEGAVFLYHGGPGGLTPGACWMAESNQVGGEFGFSLASAGDVNGDGFGDIVIGAPGYDGDLWNEGKAFVYLGNDGDGRPRIPRQARSDESAPIWLLGRSDSPSSFRAMLQGRTPAGRGRVRLEWEVKPAAEPLDGTGLVIGPSHDTGPGAAGVPLSALATGLAPGSLYHWRLRTVTDSPLFPRSPWFWLPYNALSEADIRTEPIQVAVPAEDVTPAAVRLRAATPNPFQTFTAVRYALPRSGHVRLRVIDVQGRMVRELAAGVREAGWHEARWNGRDGRGDRLPGGAYFVRLDFAGTTQTCKIVLMR